LPEKSFFGKNIMPTTLFSFLFFSVSAKKKIFLPIKNYSLKIGKLNIKKRNKRSIQYSSIYSSQKWSRLTLLQLAAVGGLLALQHPSI
jgi:hypothetical protein